jgi:hypothetical protein
MSIRLLTIISMGLGWTTADALALRLKERTPAQIVSQAEAVVEGAIVRIHAPTATKSSKNVLSVATIKIATAFKGPVKAGQSIDLLYWSHRRRPLGWKSPWHLKNGDRGVFVLTRINKHHRRGYRAFVKPRRASRARWVFWSNWYRGIIQSTAFRYAASAWQNPKRYLKDPPRRGAALYYLAMRNQVSAKTWRSFLRSDSALDVLHGCQALARSRPGKVPSRQVLDDLIDLALRKRWPQKKLRVNHNETRLERALSTALRRISFNLRKDRRAVERLLGEKPATPAGEKWMRNYFSWQPLTHRLLRAAASRAHFTRRLRDIFRSRSSRWGLSVLFRLDARAAVAVDRRLPTREIPSQSGRRIEALRKLTKKARHFTVFDLHKRRLRTAGPTLRSGLAKAIRRSLVKTVGGGGVCETRYLIDIYSKRNTKGLEAFARVQLWVCPDGSYGASWAPLSAWGRSKQLAKLLQSRGLWR